MKYRTDIEGLRALSILLVVAAHAGVPGLEGGFIGVDIFFVISGYLITGLLVGESLQTGKIDFANFYARRFRRLLPALLVMLLVVAVAVGALYPPREQQSQAIAGATAALWASNLHFAFSRIEYFGAQADSNIYLHTWSLGVEEQFYLIWPLLVLLLIKRKQGSDPSGRLVYGMTAVLLVGLGINLWLTQVSNRYAFYLMPARAWQFAAGALVFFYISRVAGRSGDGNQKSADFAGLTGILLIVGAVALLDSHTPYPGAWAILPTIGASLLIISGSRNSNSIVARTLSTQPMQVLGRLSYSWYLWHWPVLLIGALVVPENGIGSRLGWVAISLALAVLSFFLVERPIRTNGAIIRRPSALISISLALMAATVLLLIRWGSSARDDGSQAATQAPFQIEMPSIYGLGCDEWYHTDRLTPCTFGAKDAEKTAVVIGDSIGMHWFPAYERVFAGPEWRLIVLTKSACPMVDRPIYYPRIGREYVECEVWRQHALEYIKQLQPDTVVMGSTHTAAYTKDDWIEGTRSVIAEISPHVHNLAIIRSTPALPFDGFLCVSARSRVQALSAPDGSCSAPARDQRNDQVYGWILRATAGFPNVRTIDMNDLVCPQGVCRASADDMLVFRDSQHLNAGFVASLAEPLAARLRAADARGPRR